MKQCQVCFSEIHEEATKCPVCGELVGFRRIGSNVVRLIGFVSLFVSTVAVIFPYMKDAYGFTDSKIIGKIVNIRDGHLYVNFSNLGEKPGVVKDIGFVYKKRLPFENAEKQQEFLLNPGDSLLLELTPSLNLQPIPRTSFYSEFTAIPLDFINKNFDAYERMHFMHIPQESFAASIDLLDIIGSFDETEETCRLSYNYTSFRGKEDIQMLSDSEGESFELCNQLRGNVFSQRTELGKIWGELQSFHTKVQAAYDKSQQQN